MTQLACLSQLIGCCRVLCSWRKGDNLVIRQSRSGRTVCLSGCMPNAFGTIRFGHGTVFLRRCSPIIPVLPYVPPSRKWRRTVCNSKISHRSLIGRGQVQGKDKTILSTSQGSTARPCFFVHISFLLDRQSIWIDVKLLIRFPEIEGSEQAWRRT